MRICSRCKNQKENEDFPWKSKAKSIRQKHCKTCQSELSAIWYTNNKARQISNSVKNRLQYRKVAQEFVINYLQQHPCIDCNNPDIRVLDFDHLSNKIKNVATMVADGSALESIKAEIQKCEVVCANCHRIRTFSRMKKCYKMPLSFKG